MSRYLFISAALHLAVILVLWGAMQGGDRADMQAVYEVAVVGGVPSDAGGGDTAPGVSRQAPARRFVYTRRAAPSLGDVVKERPGDQKTPYLDLAPKKEKEQRGDVDDTGGDADQITAPSSSAQAQGGSPARPGGGFAAEIMIWKTRVRGMVEGVWRTPPEVEVMDLTLQTTYLLRVSRTGELLQKKLLVSSGNSPFDRSVLVALSRIQRFPPPPLSLVAGGDWVEVTMSFTPPKGAP